MKIKLIADSTCDLSDDLVKKHNIRIAPLGISFGDKILKDGVEVTPKDIFDYVDSGKGVCRTSAVNVTEYREIYKEELSGHDAIINFTISSEMSACYQNACLAAEGLRGVYIVDSRNLSAATGHLILDTVEMAATGMPANKIYRKILRRRSLLDTSFIIDTLTYLHKGGRCTAIQSIASSVLKIKPCIQVADGKMNVGKKYRGKTESVLQRYIEERLADKANIDPRRVFIAHSMMEQNQVDRARALLTGIIPFKEVHETITGGTISCHCGPNTLGLAFFRKA